ncbi:hypothetical protein SSX86_020946 [Deinandra increscens subsp. villosa]|uniref:pantothenate kinase n=1 Tax=Deinandra increscens subsp. villosa TaxID=3103831 RepID=A0AAP0CTY8_9ASTR
MEGDGIQELALVNSPVDEISHMALDIGGSLIKMVYFSTSREKSIDKTQNSSSEDNLHSGRLYFVKFETSKIVECLDFISSKLLHCRGMHLDLIFSNSYCNYALMSILHYGFPASDNTTIKLIFSIMVKATGGGAFKFADLFKEKLGISLDKVDEMGSLVSGANFLLKSVQSEAFTYENGQRNYVQLDHNDLYPYLLVNIGSGVSMIKVDGDGKFERVSGTSVGGGTFWGLGKLLTKCKSFDDLLEMSHQGNNRVIDMLVGDIYGGMDYLKIGLSSTAIASSFGKAVSENKELEEYRPEDVARSLLRMISNNIGQIAYLNALRFGLKKIFFGGFFIRGHAYTMDTISVAVDFWSKGEAKAMYMRHEGFLGALGAFMNYQLVEESPHTIRLTGNTNQNPLVEDLNDNGIIECRVDGDGKFERVSGTSVGGGTFWGLGKLLTKCKSFDDLLEMSHQGNNRVIDMLVGDIYGGMDYLKIGLSSTAIASSFGKAVSENKELEEYRPEDVARSLLRMISNNIGQIAYLNALRFGLKKIFFGGFFIRGHAYTMDTISVAVDFWSKGEAKAMYMRHEGFLGALGAFMNYQLVEESPHAVRLTGNNNQNLLVEDLNDNGIIECRVRANN